MDQVKKELNMVKESVKGFVNEEDGVGIIEVILILVILIGFVALFKDQIDEVIQKALGNITTDSGKVTH
ncbi:MAG: Flp1 family type IVb pilin [bacterium]|nr:Flp1 family type IVb pilin [bacterium]